MYQFFPNITNTCCMCGELAKGVYAPHRDAALAGVVLCAGCADVEGLDDVEAVEAEVEVKASDAARKLADEAGITIADVAATLEPGKQVTKPDVEAYLQGQGESE